MQESKRDDSILHCGIPIANLRRVQDFGTFYGANQMDYADGWSCSRPCHCNSFWAEGFNNKKCACKVCHEEHEAGGIVPYVATCERCLHLVLRETEIGIRCAHGYEDPQKTDYRCPECERFYEVLNVN